MLHPKILEGPVFDYEYGKKCMDNLFYADGEVNWMAAHNADPGVTQCPTCFTYFWKDGRVLECTECGTQWEAWQLTSCSTKDAAKIRRAC